MYFSKTKSMKNINNFKKENWKADGQKYLKELQAFLDKAENIENEELKKEIIFQMLKCDNELTVLAEEKFKEISLQGKNYLRENSDEND